MVDSPEKIWPLGGYAPGNYLCKCHVCEKQFTGDKRAITCIECAVSGAKHQIAELRAEREIDRINTEQIMRRSDNLQSRLEALAAENARLRALPLKDEVERVFQRVLKEVQQTNDTHTRNAGTDFRARMFFTEHGDALLSRLRAGEKEGWRSECATEGCNKQATVHFERGGVGSCYCHECYMRIQALPAAPSEQGGDRG